jgi:protein NRD1
MLGGQTAAPPAVPASIMEALANMARQSATTAQSNASLVAPTPPPTHAPPPFLAQGPAAAAAAPAPYSLPGQLPAAAPAVPPNLLAQLQQTMSSLPISQPSVHLPPASAPPLPFQIPQPVQNGQYPPPIGLPPQSNPPNGFQGATPPTAAPGAVDPKILVLIQALAAQNLPIEQITAIVSQMAGSSAAAPAPAPVALPQYPQPVQNGYVPAPGNWTVPRTDESRDRPYQDHNSRGRSRSRSPPPRRWDAQDSPRARDDRPSYGEYGRRPSPNRNRNGDHGRGNGSDYRQRSPQGRGSDQHREMPAVQAAKWVEHDPKLPNGHIRVLSRTLFVGGVTMPEAELRDIFSRYGDVQTCIVNKDKRHAFVKMYTRDHAVAAKNGMEAARTPDNALRTRWGVGFGPRDCSDYQTGISVIPIAKLTEADRKWMLTAPYGGSGGRPITTGMVVEEPDIEIGAGVSSKAISRRMQTDRSGVNGPKSSKDGGDGGPERGGNGGGGEGRFGRRNRGRGGGKNDDNSRGNANESGGGGVGPNGGPAMPELPFGLQTGPNGMPIFPPGFTFPAPDSQATGRF